MGEGLGLRRRREGGGRGYLNQNSCNTYLASQQTRESIVRGSSSPVGKSKDSIQVQRIPQRFDRYNVHGKPCPLVTCQADLNKL